MFRRVAFRVFALVLACSALPFLHSSPVEAGKRTQMIRRFPVPRWCPFRSGHTTQFDLTSAFTFDARSPEATVWFTVDSLNDFSEWNNFRLDNIVVVEAAALGPVVEGSCYNELETLEGDFFEAGPVESYDFDETDPRVVFYDFFIKGGPLGSPDGVRPEWRSPVDIAGRRPDGTPGTAGPPLLPTEPLFWVNTELDPPDEDRSASVPLCSGSDSTPCIDAAGGEDGSLGIGRETDAFGVASVLVSGLERGKVYAVLGRWNSEAGNPIVDPTTGGFQKVTLEIGVTTLEVDVVSAAPQQTVTVTVESGPATPGDVVGLYEVGAPDGTPLDWLYLDGTQTLPVDGLEDAELAFDMPAQDGAYEFRFFEDDDFSRRLATTREISVESNHDFFSQRISLEGPSGQTMGSNVDATGEAGEPEHAGVPGGRSVWWSWVAPVTGTASFDTHGSDFDTLLAVYTGSSVGGLTEIASNDDDGSPDLTSGLSFPAQQGVEYQVAVDGFLGATGNVVLNWCASSGRFAHRALEDPRRVPPVPCRLLRRAR